ncbi:MAG TPA: GTPase Era [Hellea balneolensis]|uniref:GTPase Era n=1 Tax=Hellea balneolensis TaxID=287478 RepID=A0A7C3GE04_9PROT|nr:GTPase Era [Hellea balneolensis]
MTTQELQAKDKKTKAGFVAIIGAPNAGKSTLVNALVGEKVSIVTHKIQTTRFQVRGIAMIDTEDARAQVVLVDTPGIFDPKHRLDRAMVHAAWSGVADADAIVHVVDADAFYKAHMHKAANNDSTKTDASGQDKKSYKDTLRVIEGLKKRGEGKAVFLALNKIDLLPREHLLTLIKELENTGVYKDIFLLSALKGNGVDTLSQTLADHVQLGPFFYPEDQAADIPSRLLAAEITREKLFLRLHNELPYASHVETQDWKHQKNGIRIEQIIYVRRKSQKPIVLGKNGNTIKKIGQAARIDMSEAFGTNVHLFLFVKVRENWSEDRSKYFESGLKFDA